MSARFDASGEYYEGTTGVPAANVWSVCFWALMSVDRGIQGPIGFSNGTESSGPAAFLSDAPNLKCYDLGVNGNGFGAFTLTAGTWYRMAITVNGGNCTWYRAAAGNALTSASVTNFAGPDGGGNRGWRLGFPSFASEWWNGRLAAVKCWDAELTLAEVENELAQYQPRRIANLLHNHPFVTTEAVDYSGNGNTLSGGTGSSTEDGPPICWGGAVPRVTAPDATVAQIGPVYPISQYSSFH